MEMKNWLQICAAALLLAVAIPLILSHAVAEEEFSELQVITDKESYLVEETILISVAPEEIKEEVKEKLTITVKTDEKTFNYIGIPEFPVKFSFPEEDTYTIQLIHKATNSVISEKTINVGRPETEEIVEPSTEIQRSPPQEIPGIINPEGLILENYQGIKRPRHIELVRSFRGPELILYDPIQAVKSIRFRGLRDETPPRLGIEDREPVPVYGMESVRSYAIDPTTVDFDEATVTAVAEGNTLFMCKEYNFTTQDCYGDWERVRDLTPGEIYTFTLTPEDPLFTETNESFDCSCSDSFTGNQDGEIFCEAFCPHTINVPEGAVSFFLESITYNMSFTRTHSGGNIQNLGGSQAGYYDVDQVTGNGNEVLVGSDTISSTGTTSLTWTNSDVPQSGSNSFTEDNCDNWPDYCTYYVYINASAAFGLPGNPQRTISIDLSVDSISYTLNYTEPGDFSVTLDSPPNNHYTNNSFPEFGFIPLNAHYNIENCSIYTSEGGWSVKNTTDSVQNGSVNYLRASFSSDGSYQWNVECVDENSEAMFAPSNRTINIDTVPPVVNLISPDDEEEISDENVISFFYNVSDDSPIVNCSLIINGSVALTDYSVVKDAEQSITQSLSNGVYEWNVMCFDQAGNYGVGTPRLLTVDVEPVIFTGLWFETAASDCTSFPCQIGLAQQTDGTINTISGTIPSGITITIVEAISPFIGSNGAEIQGNTDVLFSSYFSEVDNNLHARWHLYKQSGQGTNSLLCAHDSGTQIATITTGSCSNTSDVRILSTDRLFYVITLRVSQGAASRSFAHDVDHDSSFVNITGFRQLGFLSASLTNPSSALEIGQGSLFNVTCDIACEYGYCLDTEVYVQSNQSGSWADIDGSGTLQLSDGQDNPLSVGTIFNSTNTTTFSLEGGTPGVAHVRCYAESKYYNATSGSEQVTVSVTEEPVITLDYPENDSWINDEPVVFLYTPQTFSTIDECSLFINGVWNQTDTEAQANVQNSFSVSGLNEERYNWSVSCTDIGSLTGNSTTFYFDIDRQAPYNLTIHYPEDGANITQSTVDFSWTVQDLRSPNMTCELYINSTLNQTVTSFNDTQTNISVEGFDIGNYNWFLSCYDLAGNTNTSDTFDLTISDVPPNVTLVSPLDLTGINTSIATLEYIPGDGFGIQECSLFINNTFNQSNSSIDTNNINTFEVPVDEDMYTWYVECLDLNNNIGTSDEWTFFVDFTQPTVTLHSPAPESYFETSTIEFSYTGFDNWPPLTCTINFNDEPSITTNTTSGTTVNEIGTGYLDGYHYWDVMCVDVGGNTGISDTWNLTINQSPVITQDFPLNNSHLSVLDLDLLYTPVDNDGFESCELYLNGAFNQINSTNITSGIQSNFTLTGLDEGYYNWSVMCVDSGIFSNIGITPNLSFVVDRTPPSLELITPNEGQIINVSSYNFSWVATDVYSENMSCDLYINGSINASGIISPNGSIENYTVTGLSTGFYNWSMACYDAAGNVNISETRNFEVLLPPKVTLLFPANDSGDYLRDVLFAYIPSEGGGSFPSCSLILNGEVNQTNTSIIPDDENYFFVENLSDGMYEWNVQCVDNNALIGEGDESWIFYIDTEPPYSVELLSPLNDSVEERNNVSFTFIARDVTSPNMMCDVYVTEDQDTFVIGEDLFVLNDTEFTYNYLLSDGNYSWFVNCTDKAGLYNVSVENFFEVNAPPNVTLISPENVSWFNVDNVVLTYFPEDDFSIVSCELFINGNSNQTSFFINNRQNNTFSLGNLDQGEYNWTVACTDSDANTYAPPNWTFYVDMDAPDITLHNPLIDEPLDTSTVTFNWTASDNMSPLMMCDLYVDGVANRTGLLVNNSEPFQETVSGFTDGDFNWSVMCADLASNTDMSETRNFSVQEPPTVLLGEPPHNYRNNTVNMTLFFTAFDNSGEIDECTLLLNGDPNQTNTNISHGVENNFTLTNLPSGSYTWDVQCIDPSSNVGVNGTPKSFHVDLDPPIITLLEPEMDETFNLNNITFLWNAVDFNESIPISCDLFVTDPLGDRTAENITGFSGQNFTYMVTELEDGEHFWNVTCTDDLGNTGFSDTWRFIINQPDLYIDETRIAFNNTNPDLFEMLNITANVSNIGGISAFNVLVEFWQGHPDDGGVFIGNDTGDVSFNGSTIFSVNWSIPEGYHEIHVFVDPNNEIAELNKSNNNASVNISVLRSMINDPLNGSIFGFDDITLNFTLQDYTTGLINYTVFVDGSPSVYEGQVTDNQSTAIMINLAEGIRNIFVRATDYLFREKDSIPITITIDLTPPVPVINTLNETWFNYSEPQINFTVSDNLASIINYTLYVNGTPDVSGNASNPETLVESLSSLSDGAYEIILEAIDDAGNAANTTPIIIYVDTEEPVIVLESPDDGANFTTRDVELNYTVYDNMASTAICEINVSGTSYGPFSVDTGVEQNFLVENLPEGIHFWNVSCFDQAGNWNISETRHFNVFIPPEVTLLSPPDDYWSNESTNTLTYNVSDDTGILECRLYLNGVLNDTDDDVQNNAVNEFVVENMNGLYSWRVECIDNTTFNSVGVSDEWTLNVDTEAPVPNITTQNNTWFNTDPELDFIITDNLAPTINYTVYVNGTSFVNGTTTNNTAFQETLTGLSDGVYEAILGATDLAGNSANSTPITFYLDTQEPFITLNYPDDEENITSTSVNLSFTPTDNLADYLMCTVTLNNDPVAENLNVSNGAEEIVELHNLSGGLYYWNVTCTDQALNTNTSETRSFFIPVPDLSVNASEIFFSNEAPSEGENITITATIRNIGGSPAEDFDVQFWQEEINISGNQIGSDINIAFLDANESINVSVNYTAIIGTTEIFVYVNPDQRVFEDDYSNNIASRNITVQFWHYALGTTNDTLRVTDASYGLLFDWAVENSTGSNIFVTDFDSDISWLSLQALGRDTNNDPSPLDFEALDAALGSINYSDSINNIYAIGGTPIETMSFEIFSSIIENVPVHNSTNNSNFKTGILWDYGTGGTQYDGTHNIVFITQVNKGAQGFNSTNDFEIRIPATLREYQGPDTERVVFYTEIK